MSTPSAAVIAAADRIKNWYASSLEDREEITLEQIVQSAIEEGYNAGIADSIKSYAAGKSLRAAQPQERHWLEEWMINFWKDKYYDERQRTKSTGILADQFKQMLTAEREERCEVCNSELSQCGAQGIDGEPSLDCLVCKLREQLADEREKHGN